MLGFRHRPYTALLGQQSDSLVDHAAIGSFLFEPLAGSLKRRS